MTPVGHNIITGDPRYNALPPATVNFAPGLPTNCDWNLDAGHPNDGDTCYTLMFPFIGRKRFGCSSDVYGEGYGGPYTRCEPVVLKSGDAFDFVSFPLRVAITAAIAWLIWRNL
jgi:hypothetical protein